MNRPDVRTSTSMRRKPPNRPGLAEALTVCCRFPASGPSCDNRAGTAVAGVHSTELPDRRGTLRPTTAHSSVPDAEARPAAARPGRHHTMTPRCCWCRWALPTTDPNSSPPRRGIAGRRFHRTPAPATHDPADIGNAATQHGGPPTKALPTERERERESGTRWRSHATAFTTHGGNGINDAALAIAKVPHHRRVPQVREQSVNAARPRIPGLG